MTGIVRRWRGLPVAQRWMLVTLAGAVALANVAQPFPEIAPLQHIPTVVLIVAAPWLLACWPLSNRAVGCILAFFLLHTFGGRYTYSNVPYEAWGQAWLGLSIDDALGLARNPYDRIVHFAFGACAIAPVTEIARRTGMTAKAALTMAFLFVGAVSALYEIFEWVLTMLAAPDMADAYNGQQGDMWDAQKDMACAIIGAAMAIVGMSVRGIGERVERLSI